MAKNLIGTSPDQLALNAKLGSMAFQDKNSVNIDGGVAALSDLDLSQIYAIAGPTASKIFVYDTSKDSDGGAWRKRCAHTAWYNEPLGTSTRGTRKDFPSVAVLVASSGGAQVSIYDGDHASLPFWGSFSSLSWDGPIRGMHALNGIIAITTYGGIGYSGDGVHFLRLLKDEFSNNSRYATYGGYVGGVTYGLKTNPTTPYYYSGNQIREYSAFANYEMNDVVMTVEPGAPLDPATQLPIPTVLIGRVGGISVIMNNGSIINRASEWWDSSTGGVARVWFDSNGGYWYLSSFYGDLSSPSYPNHASALAYTRSVHSTDNVKSPSSNSTTDVTYLQGSTPSGLGFWGANSAIWMNGHAQANFGKASISQAGNLVAAAGQSGLNIIAHNYNSGLSDSATTLNGSMIAYATKSYATGWMPANTKGCFLADSVAETIVASGNLITNGTFTSDTSGWTARGPATVVATGGVMRITSSGGDYGQAYQAIATTPGKTYRLAFDIPNKSGSYAYYYVGTSAGASDVYSSYTTVNSTNLWMTFTATATTTYITFQSQVSGTYIDVDNVSCYAAESDRCVHNNGLIIVGSLNKTQVAANSTVVGYSGFSASNYLYQPYNSQLDFGSAEYFLNVWVNSNSNSLQYIANRSTGDNDESLRLTITNNIVYFDYGIGAPYVQCSTAFPLNTWTMITVAVRAGQPGRVFYNGVECSYTNQGAAAATFPNSTAYQFVVGYHTSYANGPFLGSMALLRIGGTIPSDEQIKRIYNDEKQLFLENAKATLYGDSNVITAAHFDQDTKLLHVGTSAGRSVFQGLRRIDNTTTPVNASLHSAAGLVAEY